MGPIRAFFAHSFGEADKRIVEYFKIIARHCGFAPVSADEPAPSPPSEKVRELLAGAECLVAILTPSAVSESAASGWVYQETGMAFQQGLPLLVFVEESVEDLGLLPNETDHVRFNRNRLEEVLGRALSYFCTVRSKATGQRVQEHYTKGDVRDSIEHYADVYDSRLFVNLLAKQEIASYVLKEFIKPDMKGIMLDSGTVTYVIADALVDAGLKIPIVTNNVAVVAQLEVFHYPVTILPGEYDFRTKGVGGCLTAKAAKRYLRGKMNIPIDIAILAANAIDPDLGFSADNRIFSGFRATILKHAKEVVLVLQGEKFIKPVLNPVVTKDKWHQILQHRGADSSMWVVCHQPARSYSASANGQYSNAVRRFKATLPQGHFIEIT
ncbi:MAG: DeoR/GlpR transcriptional regulator [Phycisphaerales bacterium]|nr:MAG: DeoR/GlpR transcriptional regulator [Phycisphaerales bacterium]